LAAAVARVTHSASLSSLAMQAVSSLLLVYFLAKAAALAAERALVAFSELANLALALLSSLVPAEATEVAL